MTRFRAAGKARMAVAHAAEFPVDVVSVTALYGNQSRLEVGVKKRIDRGERPPLVEILAMALRFAREAQGYSLAQIDTAVAEALLIETMQRTMNYTGAQEDKLPAREDVLRGFRVVMGDVQQAAMRTLGVSLQ